MESMTNLINITPKTTEHEPPWKIHQVNVCEIELEIKQETPPSLKAAFFKEHMNAHTNSLHIYTDGSKSNHGVGSAVTIPSLSLSDSKSLPKQASIFTAEATAILMALDLIKVLPNKTYTIFTDSKSVTETLKQFEPKNPLLQRAKSVINYAVHTQHKAISLCWCPAHTGIRGNETVDIIAKMAANNPPTQTSLPYTDYIPLVRDALNKKWQNRWDLETNNKLQEIKPKIGKWESSFHKKRKYETIMTRLRIGHSNITHVHLMTRERQPRCCGVPLTVKHFLVICKRHENERELLFPGIHHLRPKERMKKLLSDSKDINIEKLVKYLRDIGVYNKI